MSSSASLFRAAGALTRRIHSSALRSAEAAAASELSVTIATPPRPLVNNKVVNRITLPGRAGVFAIEKNSPPMLSELKPGTIRVDYPDNTSEEFFVPGGFVFKHPNNTVDVSAPDGVKLDQIDADALRAANAEATKKRDAATPGSAEHAEARIALDVYKALGYSLKVTL